MEICSRFKFQDSRFKFQDSSFKIQVSRFKAGVAFDTMYDMMNIFLNLLLRKRLALNLFLWQLYHHPRPNQIHL